MSQVRNLWKLAIHSPVRTLPQHLIYLRISYSNICRSSLLHLETGSEALLLCEISRAAHTPYFLIFRTSIRRFAEFEAQYDYRGSLLISLFPMVLGRGKANKPHKRTAHPTCRVVYPKSILAPSACYSWGNCRLKLPLRLFGPLAGTDSFMTRSPRSSLSMSLNAATTLTFPTRTPNHGGQILRPVNCSPC